MSGLVARKPSRSKSIVLRVNGVSRRLEVDVSDTLAEVLREKLGLRGTKIGCDRGECGSCTVIVDGEALLSCTMLAVSADGKSVQTIEGLQQDGVLHPIQRAFIDHTAFQCGYCSPGMILSLKALFDANPTPTPLDIREAVAGNICRCGTYPRVIAAALSLTGTKTEENR